MSVLKKRFFYFDFRKPDLRKLFKSWDDILRLYENENHFKDDLPYWYRERTNIGHLALAAYQLNGYPLQEFSIKKGKGAKKSPGRADLYIYIPKGNSYFNIEAKQINCSIDPKQLSKESIRRALKDAVKDLKKLKEKGWEAKYGMAMIFILLYKKVSNENNDIKKQFLSHFNKQIKQIVKKLKANFVAIHYADIKVSTEVYRKYKDKKCKDIGENWHPGIAVIGKIINNSK